MFENENFKEQPAPRELAPSDVTYNFGAKTATSTGVKVFTYVASALTLGGSLFVGQQILSPANLQHANQANAQGTDGAEPTASGAANTDAASAGTASPDATAGAETPSDLSNLQVSGASHKGSAAGSSNADAPANAPVSNTGSGSGKSSGSGSTVVVPPPTFNHGNTSSATPGSSSGSGTNAGSGSSHWGDHESDDNEEHDGGDD